MRIGAHTVFELEHASPYDGLRCARPVIGPERDFWRLSRLVFDDTAYPGELDDHRSRGQANDFVGHRSFDVTNPCTRVHTCRVKISSWCFNLCLFFFFFFLFISKNSRQRISITFTYTLVWSVAICSAIEEAANGENAKGNRSRRDRTVTRARLFFFHQAGNKAVPWNRKVRPDWLVNLSVALLLGPFRSSQNGRPATTGGWYYVAALVGVRSFRSIGRSTLGDANLSRGCSSLVASSTTVPGLPAPPIPVIFLFLPPLLRIGLYLFFDEVHVRRRQIYSHTELDRTDPYRPLGIPTIHHRPDPN